MSSMEVNRKQVRVPSQQQTVNQQKTDTNKNISIYVVENDDSYTCGNYIIKKEHKIKIVKDGAPEIKDGPSKKEIETVLCHSLALRSAEENKTLEQKINDRLQGADDMINYFKKSLDKAIAKGDKKGVAVIQQYIDEYEAEKAALTDNSPELNSSDKYQKLKQDYCNNSNRNIKKFLSEYNKLKAEIKNSQTGQPEKPQQNQQTVKPETAQPAQQQQAQAQQPSSVQVQQPQVQTQAQAQQPSSAQVQQPQVQTQAQAQQPSPAQVQQPQVQTQVQTQQSQSSQPDQPKQSSNGIWSTLANGFIDYVVQPLANLGTAGVGGLIIDAGQYAYNHLSGSQTEPAQNQQPQAPAQNQHPQAPAQNQQTQTPAQTVQPNNGSNTQQVSEAPKPEPQSTTAAVEKPAGENVSQKKENFHSVKTGGMTWEGIVKTYYPELVDKCGGKMFGADGAIRQLKMALSEGSGIDLVKATDIPKTLNLPLNLNGVEFKDNEYKGAKIRKFGGHTDIAEAGRKTFSA